VYISAVNHVIEKRVGEYTDLQITALIPHGIAGRYLR
jgi:hypothetical protein